MTNKPPKPSVVVFFTDQQRWDTSGLHGNPEGLMPNFDGMAQAGTHLPNFFSCQPVCGPARACLQTGLYATQAGVHRNGLALRPESQTLAHCFREAGYTTGYIGKWHLASDDIVKPDQRGGYEYWLASNILEFTSEPYRTVMYDEECRPVFLPGYRVDALADAAVRYIDRNRDRPFYLVLSFLEPHHQNQRDNYPAPRGYEERYRKSWTPPDLVALGGSAAQHLAGYYGMVRRLDEALGRILDALRSLELEQRTILLFASDHGCHFKTRNAEYKRSCHDSSIRVPAAFCGPGFQGGGRIAELVSLVDVTPTLLDAAGIAVPDHMAGRSILPLLRGNTATWPEEVFIQISEDQVGRAVRTRRWKYSVFAPGRDGFRDPASDRYEEQYLYDLEADPYELTNLIHSPAHREVAEVMKQRLLRRMKDAGERQPQILAAELLPDDSGGNRAMWGMSQRKVGEHERWE